MSPRNYLSEPYARVVKPDKSGGYFAEILEFPGCFGEGDTIEEAYKDLEGAAVSWIEARLSQGQEVPGPFDNVDYSGNISLRLPRSIHKRAAILAERDRVSLNSFLLGAIATRVGAEDFYSVMAERLEPVYSSNVTFSACTFVNNNFIFDQPMDTATGTVFQPINIPKKDTAITTTTTKGFLPSAGR
jgi:antitoxin HicB